MDLIKTFEKYNDDFKLSLSELDNKVNTKIELNIAENLTNNLRNKINIELAKKLDRIELKTNNSQMKKKVSSYSECIDIIDYLKIIIYLFTYLFIFLFIVRTFRRKDK